MKIFSALQIRACDAYTIHATGITSRDLMERAAGKCVEWLMANFEKEALFVVLCGTGNNGGDGLVITRMLNRLGYGAKAFLLQFSEELSTDCKANLERLQNIDSSLVDILQPETFITDIPANIVIVDAILGTGLNRQAEGWIASFIGHINDRPNRKVSIDIPSGMPADNVPGEGAAIIKADDTLSFQFYKRAFLHPETGTYAGNVHILDIGLHETFISSTHSNYQTIDEADVRAIYKPRLPFSHKGTFGTALLIGGSYGMMGAISLATKAAGRAGAGKVRSLVPECGYSVIQTLVPEAMCGTKGEKYITRIADWENADAIGIGPGIGTKEETIKAFANFLEACKQPVVIDADGLNILAKQPELLHKIPAGSVLTPHPGEFERLFGKTANSMLRLEHARTQAMKFNITIVLKDRYTAVISSEGECRYNITGNAGLATAGSGDVLTGIITGLISQKYDPHSAAVLGVYLHGLAGESASQIHSEEAMVAGDVIDALGKAFQTIR
ncbi:NAD(P)H-hydrate dehydratase [Polluticoccus soli]|uniref:NAD(P)H-hydrate dehydratase n=1 Tax=Polluticoccus soli TaxID=3034150 RepID=UPI0023E268A3|nr:NAD(P)H-hydrate dehydratase [Flavipsychrobacter sp. JY13-12]